MLKQSAFDLEKSRTQYDERRADLDSARGELQAVHRSQFDAEKKVAVADTSIVNMQRSIAQLQDEQMQRGQEWKEVRSQTESEDRVPPASQIFSHSRQ